jgi:hypothetical protein
MFATVNMGAKLSWWESYGAWFQARPFIAAVVMFCFVVVLPALILLWSELDERAKKRTRQIRVLEEVRAFKATEQKLIDARRSHDFWADMYESIFKGR